MAPERGSRMGNVIMVVSDALRDDTAALQMGYLQHLVEAEKATRYTVVAELPTMSRPLYETLHTGVPVSVHGVTHNRVVRRSTMPNVFEEAGALIYGRQHAGPRGIRRRRHAGAAIPAGLRPDPSDGHGLPGGDVRLRFAAVPQQRHLPGHDRGGSRSWVARRRLSRAGDRRPRDQQRSSARRNASGSAPRSALPDPAGRRRTG